MERVGVTLWRQISDELRQDIQGGRFEAGDRVPNAQQLANRFGVNRHTILRALAQLEDDGYLRVERGRGSFVSESVSKLMFGPHTRFEENLLQNRRLPSRQLISIEEIPADRTKAKALGVRLRDALVMVTLVSEADKLPISFGHNYFSKARLPGVADAFRDAAATVGGRLSITGVLSSLGVARYRRSALRFIARAPNSREVRYLHIPKQEYVLEVEATNVDDAGKPLIYAVTSFASSRVQCHIEL